MSPNPVANLQTVYISETLSLLVTSFPYTREINKCIWYEWRCHGFNLFPSLSSEYVSKSMDDGGDDDGDQL